MLFLRILQIFSKSISWGKNAMVSKFSLWKVCIGKNYLESMLEKCGSKHTCIWDKVFKNGPSKIYGRQRLQNLKGCGLLLLVSYSIHSWILGFIYRNSQPKNTLNLESTPILPYKLCTSICFCDQFCLSIFFNLKAIHVSFLKVYRKINFFACKKENNSYNIFLESFSVSIT